MKRAVLTIAILYLILLCVAAVLMRSSINSYWLVTLFLFSPRWVATLPLLLLVPLTIWIRPRILWIYLVHALVLCFLILGFKIGGAGWTASQSSQGLRVLTGNLGGGDVDVQKLKELIEDGEIQIAFFQECSPRISSKLFSDLQWNSVVKGYIAIGSVHELGELEVLAKYPRSHYSVKASIGCEVRPPGEFAFRVSTVHLPTFRPALEELRHFDFENGPVAMSEMGDLYRSIAEQAHRAIEEPNPAVIVAGDFNVPVESVFYQDYWSDMTNAFSEVGSGLGHTKFTRWHGVRIDHVLVGSSWKPVTARVGPDLGGDHRPVIVELVRVPE